MINFRQAVKEDSTDIARLFLISSDGLADGKPVPYPYRRGMRVINLIALAGGFTYRAVEDDRAVEDECVAFITRIVGERVCAGAEALIFPGDVIEIKVRYF